MYIHHRWCVYKRAAGCVRDTLPRLETRCTTPCPLPVCDFSGGVRTPEVFRLTHGDEDSHEKNEGTQRLHGQSQRLIKQPADADREGKDKQRYLKAKKRRRRQTRKKKYKRRRERGQKQKEEKEERSTSREEREEKIHDLAAMGGQ